eukprot:scaffold6818_cov103-Isochrysis_galbana.AAC.7
MTPRLPPRGLLGTRRRRSAEPNTEGGQVDEHGPGDDPDEHADGGCQQGERVAVRVAERVGGVEVLHGLGHDGAARGRWSVLLGCGMVAGHGHLTAATGRRAC